MIDVMDAIAEPNTKHILVAAISHSSITITNKAATMTNNNFIDSAEHQY